MTKLYDVVIAGAGPVGLFLACELALAHVSVMVLERDAQPGSAMKAAPLGRRGLNTVSVEALYRRGLLGKLFDVAKRTNWLPEKGGAFQFGGHFAGISLNVNELDLDRWKYRIPGPALSPGPSSIAEVEKVLIERAESLGVTILRGCGVKGILAQDDDSVTVEAGDDSQPFRGRWLVGCDGGHSIVRKAAGFELVGTDPQCTGYLAQCEFDHPEALQPGFQPTDKGMSIYMPGPAPSLYLLDFDHGAYDRRQPPTMAHLQAVWERVMGRADVHLTAMHHVSTFTDRCMQATHYRRGRVLLAGDAAHIHSPLGAQGMNLGLGDAMNLGWKLAAAVRASDAVAGTATATATALLDSYERERHPVGEWALEWTRAQVAALQPGPFGAASRALLRELLGTTDGTNLMLDRVWGLSLRYHDDAAGGGQAHALVGCSAPDFEFGDGSRLGPKLEGGRGLLLDLRSGGDGDAAVGGLKELVVGGPYESRVDYATIDAKDKRGLQALLVRPDGFVAWVSEEGAEPDLEAAQVALKQWFEF